MKLYVRVKTINSQKTTEVNLDDLGLGNGFLDTILKAQAMKEKVDKLDCIKIFEYQSTPSKSEKNNPENEENITNHMSDNRLVS